MRTSIKLSLPIYMILISVVYVLVLVFINQEFIVQNIGCDLDVKFSLLTIFIFSNTIYLEKMLNNKETFYLLSDKCKQREFRIRFFVKYAFMIILFILAYTLILCKNPNHIYMDISAEYLFLQSLYCVCCSIFLWGNLICYSIEKLGNMWYGMIVSVVVWYLMNTKLIEKIPIYLNVFSYSMTDKNGGLISGWEYGKIFALFIGMIFFIYNMFCIYNSNSKRKGGQD